MSTLGPEKCFTCQARPPEVCQTCADAATTVPCQGCGKTDAALCEGCADEAVDEERQDGEDATAKFVEGQELELTLLKRLHRAVKDGYSVEAPAFEDPERYASLAARTVYEIREVLAELRQRKLGAESP